MKNNKKAPAATLSPEIKRLRAIARKLIRHMDKLLKEKNDTGQATSKSDQLKYERLFGKASMTDVLIALGEWLSTLEGVVEKAGDEAGLKPADLALIEAYIQKMQTQQF